MEKKKMVYSYCGCVQGNYKLMTRNSPDNSHITAGSQNTMCCETPPELQ